MKTDLCLVSWNRPKMTELVIRTIKRNTKPDSYRLIVLDNDSEDSTQIMLQDMHNNGLIDELLVMDYNGGLESARQVLLNHVQSDYFICIDNDCLPPPMKLRGRTKRDWVELLILLIEKYEDYAAISARTQVMIGTGDIFEEADKTGAELVDFPHPGGSLRLMRTDAVRQVGGWDRLAPGRGSEEKYICNKLHEAGYKTAFATQICSLHLFGTRGVGNKTDRWGYDPNLEPGDTGHSDISHPALTNGDDPQEVEKYSGKELTDDYYNYQE